METDSISGCAGAMESLSAVRVMTAINSHKEETAHSELVCGGATDRLFPSVQS